MNINHLDAAALTQPGGFMDSLVKAITTAINGQGAVEDRNSQRSLDATLAQIGAQGNVRREAQGRRDRMGNLVVQAAGQGITPEDGADVDPMILDLATKLASQHQATTTEAKTAKQTALDEQKRLNDTIIAERNANIALTGAKGAKVGFDMVRNGTGLFGKAEAAKGREMAPKTVNLGTELDPKIKQWDPERKVWIDPPVWVPPAAAPPAGGGKPAEPGVIDRIMKSWQGSPTMGPPEPVGQDPILYGVGKAGSALGRILQQWQYGGKYQAGEGTPSNVAGAGAGPTGPNAPKAPSPLVTKSLTQAQVQEYAQAHGIPFDSAVKFLTSKGY